MHNGQKNIAYINNKPYAFNIGETVLTFLRRHLGEKSVPTLCDAPNLAPGGSCRMCSVEVAKGSNGVMPKVVASCHTMVAEGDQIFPHSTKIQKLRKNIIELVLTDHPLDCLTCEVNGNCDLQDVAAKVAIREVRYPAGANHGHYEKDLSHSYLTMDLSKCINCYQCVRECDEVQGSFVLSAFGRGFDTKIIKGLDTTFEESPCVSCGACVQACPTSAISDIYYSKSVVAEEKTRTVCTYCGVGCNLEVAKSNGNVLSITAPYDAEVNQGHTCLKGRFAFKFYKHPERLRTPLIKRDGEFVPVSWDEAYDFIIGKLNSIKEEFGPTAIGGISSSRCTNEENYLMQKFIRTVIGTNNIDGCARVCHSPTALGMQRSFGTGAATNSIEDLKFTECVLVIGANPTAGHPVTGAKIKQHSIRSKTLIVIDPVETEIAKYADYHLQLRPGTNVAVLNMMLYYIIQEGLVDEKFVETRTEGFEDFKEQLMKINLDELEEISGVKRELAREAAIAYASADAAMSFHGLGVTEHTQGTFTVRLIADLAMITGNVGRRGVGVNPLRGQNNVQGSADMGVQPHQGPGYLPMADPESRRHYESIYGVTMPTDAGLTIPKMLKAATEGRMKAMWIIGEDLVQTEPNTNKVMRQLGALDLLVVQELFMTETAKLADVVLPGASFLEKSGTFTNGERRIQRVNQVVEPVGQSKADGQIISEVMTRMGFPQPDYDPAIVLQEVSQAVPFFRGVKWEELGENGKQWPVAEDGTDTQILHTSTFKRGLGNFFFADFVETTELVDNQEEYPFILTTNRNLEHYNCGAMTRNTPNVEINGEDILLMHPLDAQSKGISDGSMVRLSSPRGEATIRARVTEEVNPGILSTTFHFPEIMINKITSDVLDTEADCPEYKVVAVDIEKV